MIIEGGLGLHTIPELLIEPEANEDLDDETFVRLASLTVLDQEEEENLQRDETY